MHFSRETNIEKYKYEIFQGKKHKKNKPKRLKEKKGDNPGE